MWKKPLLGWALPEDTYWERCLWVRAITNAMGTRSNTPGPTAESDDGCCEIESLRFLTRKLPLLSFLRSGLKSQLSSFGRVTFRPTMSSRVSAFIQRLGPVT